MKAKILFEANSVGVGRQISDVPSQSNAISVKPPLKWAGGKRWLLPHLALLWKAHKQRRYVEPFCGGLAAALGLEPKQALLNDVNPHLINFYNHLQKGLDVTIRMENASVSFYRCRNRFNHLINHGEAGCPQFA